MTRRSAGLLALVVLAAAGCGGSRSVPATTASRHDRLAVARHRDRRVSSLRLPVTRSRVLPGYLLVADRNNDRVLLLSSDKRIVWSTNGLPQPDDAFFTPGYGSVITNEEFDDTLTEISLRRRGVVWRYGHASVPGRSPGYLDSPDDAYRLPGGITTVADIHNCRIVQLRRDGSVRRILGGSCVHDPPRGFASPNGDTPLPDGGLLVTEIGGWIDRLDRAGRLVWSVHSPVSYPSDAQLLPDGRVLVASFTTPGKIVIVDRSGRVTWSFGAASGPNRLAKPSLAVRWPNGLIASNDDYNHRVIVIDPRTKRIVWQYGHTGVSGSAPGYLSKPDGLDLLPATDLVRATQQAAPKRKAAAAAPARAVQVKRVGSLPQPVSKLSAVALPDGRLVVLGGLVGGSSSSQVLAGPASRLQRVASLPVATHDAAAALVGGRVYLFGGGEAVSTDAVVRFDPASHRATRAGSLGEPLSDLGAATIGAKAYLVGGYTGTRYATAVLRFRPGAQPTLVTRLPVGLRYAGVAALGSKIYVAGGLSTSGPTRAVYAVDPAAGTVTRVATLPRAIDHAALAALGHRLLLVGGGSRQVLAIDPAAGTVAPAATLPQSLTDPAAVAVNGKVLVLGGGPNAIYALG